MGGSPWAGAGDASDPSQLIHGTAESASLVSEIWTAVIYHNRTPSFTTEVKIDLPISLTGAHHILFTIYHIRCSPKKPYEQVRGRWPPPNAAARERGTNRGHSCVCSLRLPSPLSANGTPPW